MRFVTVVGMAKALHAIDYLAAPGKHLAAVEVVFGEETFLARLVVTALRDVVLGGDDAEFSLARFDGASAEMRSVVDELSTVAMFGGGRRLVLVEDADDFVSRNRPALEDYVAAPKSTGVLVLLVKSWPSNTRLYKAVEATGLAIECSAPPAAKLNKWLLSWARARHQATLEPAAAETLVDILGPQLGLLDQQLAKLAVMVAPGESIGPALVEEAVAGWRAKTAWEMIDAALAGQAQDALAQLDRLLLAGENAIALMGQIGFTLRRFAAATRAIEQTERSGRKPNLRDALQNVGIKPFVLAKSEAQLKQTGRQRGGKLYRWLLEADLALKGSSSSPPKARIVLEQLLVRLATQMSPARTQTAR